MSDEAGYKSDLFFFASSYARKANKRLVIATDSSLILGKPVANFTESVDEGPEFVEFWETFEEYRGNKLANLDVNELKIKSIPLKDVVIKSYATGTETTLPYLVVFYKNILGISIEAD